MKGREEKRREEERRGERGERGERGKRKEERGKRREKPKIWYLFPFCPVLLVHKLIIYTYMQNSSPNKISRSLACENESFLLSLKLL